MKKFLSVVLTIAMIIGTLGVVSVGATEVLTADVVFDNINVTSDEGPAYTVEAGSNVTIELVGENYVKGGLGSAGIYVAPGATVTFIGSGSLTAVGGDASEFKPNSKDYPNLWNMYSAGAGIGGNGCSYIRNRDFVGGKLTTYYDDFTTPSFGTVIINLDEEGKISATGGNAVTNQGSGAGIGSGGSNPLVHKSEGSTEYDILFEGEIVINSGIVNAVGGADPSNPQSASAGAGIGAGCCSQAGIGNNIDITITGGTITATGAADAAAIGGGAHVEGGDIIITGGTVTAVSGEGSQSGEGAGIGAGHMMYEGIIRIEGDAVVSATANGDAAGIGAGAATATGSDSTDELHCENVIFGGNAQIEFDGGKTTFFTVEGNDVTFTSDSAVCAIVNTDGVMIGLASSFAEAISVINEFDNVDTIKLINDIVVDKTVVVEDDVTIDGNGYTLKGADYPQVVEWDDAGVTPLAIDGATVNVTNITIEGGSTANNAEYANLNSYGIAGDGVQLMNGAVLNLTNATVKGGATDAEFTRSAGSAVVTENSTLNATDSVLASGRLNARYAIAEAVIDTDEASALVLKDVTLDSPKSSYAAAEVIEIYDGANSSGEEKTVTMSGTIYLPGNALNLVNVEVPEGETLQFRGNVNSSIISDTLTIEYRKADKNANDEDTEEQFDLYDIYVVGNDQFINRLNSLDLTFSLLTNADDLDYEILEVNDEIKINNVNNLKDRFEFHFKDKDAGVEDTASEILIGQVKISGYGAYEFLVDTRANETNVAHATKTADSIVETFVPAGSTAEGNGTLDVTTNTIGATILVPTRTLTVNIDFPNAVNNNEIAYQNMQVVVSGEDLAPVTVALGTDNAGNVIVADNRPDAAYTVEFKDGKYVVVFSDALTVNTSYDIVVSGAGYRTARYTVNMQTENAKTVNFWNNVKDADADVEAGKFQAKKNFLAGDIVKDNNINVYDLSAVVSYFGETGLSADNNAAYAKYDLNRDGFIDSKDVAMVLVSWNN